MSDLILTMGLDVSGQPCEKIYVGLVSVKMNSLRQCDKNFRKKFPKELRSKQKGAKRKHSELKSIISFLNKNYIFMHSTYFPSSEWFNFEKDFPNKAYIYERIYSLLYFQLISRVCHKYTKNPYTITICIESHININKALKYVGYLLKANGYNIILNTGYANSNILIKFADYVAASHRKVEPKFLEKLERFYIYNAKSINHKYIDKIFKK